MSNTTEILLVEDNPGDAALVRAFLSTSTEFNIHHRETLDSALDYLSSNEVDLILLDFILPDGAGFEPVKVILKSYPETPIIILTGCDDESIGLDAVEMGAQDFLYKNSVNEISLRKSIKYAISRKANERQLEHLNTCLEAVRDIGKLIASEKTIDTLIQVACEKLVGTRGYESTWLIMMDELAKPTLVAYAGNCNFQHAEDGLETINTCCILKQAWDQLSDKDVWYTDALDATCSDCPMNRDNTKNAAIACKLTCDNECYGYMAAIVPTEFVKTEDEYSLFKEVTEDIAFAIHAIHVQQQREVLFHQLEDSQRLHKAIADNLPNGFVQVLDSTYNVIFSEGSALKQMGLNDNELAGRSLDYTDDLKSTLAVVFNGERTDFEYPVGDKTFLLNAKPLDSVGKTVSTILILGVDITELKQAQSHGRELEVKVQHLEKMEAIGQLAGRIAHDFNNILFPIIGYSDLAQGTVAPGSDIYKWINEIRLAGRRAQQFVSQIRLFSNGNTSDPKPYKIQSLVEDSLKLLQVTTSNSVVISKTVDLNCGPVLCDATQIHQLVLNLCNNAIEAMNGSGELKIDLAACTIATGDLRLNHNKLPGDYVTLTVSDTGTGIPPENREKIFNPYFTTKNSKQSPGLGLSLVYGIVEGCNGFIDVESEPGKETRFTVYLPVTTQVDDAKPSDRPGEVNLGSGNLLVVDDEESVVNTLKAMLECLGYSVTPCFEPQKALDSFTESPDQFELLITDLSMPTLNGNELVSLIHGIRDDIPVIVLSGYDLNTVSAACKTLNIFAELRKPIELLELSNVVKAAIGENASN